MVHPGWRRASGYGRSERSEDGWASRIPVQDGTECLHPGRHSLEEQSESKVRVHVAGVVEGEGGQGLRPQGISGQGTDPRVDERDLAKSKPKTAGKVEEEALLVEGGFNAGGWR